MELLTERCKIRNMKLEDAKELYETLSDEEVMKYIEPPFSMEQTEEFIKDAALCEPPLVYALVLNETDKVIGHVIFHLYEEDSYEIGWIINHKYHGLGIASEVTKALVEYVKGGALQEVNSLVIECDPEQEATKRIALKNGFVYEGYEDECDVYRLKL